MDLKIITFLLCLIFSAINQQEKMLFNLQPKQKLEEQIENICGFPQFVTMQSLNSNKYKSLQKTCEIYKKREIRLETVNSEVMKMNWDQWEEIKENGVIYNMSDIESLQYIQDIAKFKNTVIVLFENLTTSFFEINLEGIIVNKGHFNLTTQRKGVNYLVYNDNYCLQISGSFVFKFEENYTWTLMEGYTQIQENFQSAILYSNNNNTELVVAAGQKGVYHYNINQDTLVLKKQYTVSTPNKIINVEDLGIQDNKVFVIDKTLGLFSFQLPSSSVVNFQQPMIQKEGFKYLIARNKKVYLECEYFLFYDIEKDKIQAEYNLGIYPTDIIFNGSQLILIGHNSFGISNNIQFGIQQGKFVNRAQKSILHGNYIVSVNEFQIKTLRIIYPYSVLKCELPQNSIINGKIIGSLKIEAACRDKTVQKSKSLVIEVSSPSQYHIFEIVASIIFIWIACFCAIWLSVRHIKINKQYNELHEQATQVSEGGKNQVQISFQTNITEENQNNSKIKNTELQQQKTQ